jgi:hypothetical protein
MKRWTVLPAMGLVTAMSGCGAGQGGAPAATFGTGPGGGSGSATSIDPTASTPAPSPGPSGVAAPIVEGEVSVALDASGYAVGQKIRVTVFKPTD